MSYPIKCLLEHIEHKITMSKVVPKKRMFKRRVNITEDQNTVCKEATICIHHLDIILSKMIPIVEGDNKGSIDKVNQLKVKLDEISELINDI